MWGRNLDGQLGSGTRKDIPIPTPFTSPTTSATSSPRVNWNMTFITGIKVENGCETNVSSHNDRHFLY